MLPNLLLELAAQALSDALWLSRYIFIFLLHVRAEIHQHKELWAIVESKRAQLKIDSLTYIAEKYTKIYVVAMVFDP